MLYERYIPGCLFIREHQPLQNYHLSIVSLINQLQKNGKIGMWESYVDHQQACQQLCSNSLKMLVISFTLFFVVVVVVAFKLLNYLLHIYIRLQFVSETMIQMIRMFLFPETNKQTEPQKNTDCRNHIYNPFFCEP